MPDMLKPALDLRARREALFDVHSVLRAGDGLRPDEAFDELVKLYSLWLTAGPVGPGEARQLTPDLGLSDATYERASELLKPIFATQRSDVGADLFQELADVGIRAGLGQYFTPAPVAQAMAAYLAPQPGETWADPFCGSGLLLGEMAKAAGGPLRLFGIDRDHRVLHLASLEASVQHPDAPLALLRANALGPLGDLLSELNGPPDGFDGVVTNPPFGAELHPNDQASYAAFELARRGATPLEILGLERSIELLRPGGRLGVVLPQSILSNRRCRDVRQFLVKHCVINGLLSLPPETFAPFRGVGKAAVVFATKRPVATSGAGGTACAISRSIGWDATGRDATPSDVVEVAVSMRSAPRDDTTVAIVGEETLERNMAPEWHLRPQGDGVPLGDLCTTIFSGRTPGRAAYDAVMGGDMGNVYRVLKVGDLTNAGINWEEGERSVAALAKPVTTKLLESDDIVLTAAAHHPRYIAAKVDIVDGLPPVYGPRVFPCAEVMVLRPDKSQIDPVVMLLWLRTPEGRAAIQACVTGQTAHIYPDDVAEVTVPSEVSSSDHSDAIALVTDSLRLRRESEQSARDARRLFMATLS